MTLCWKYFVPISFADMIGTALWVAIWPNGNQSAQYVMFAGGLALLVLFMWRVVHYTRSAKMKLYFSPTI